MTPTASVIIPNYNHARFLEERIQSVLNQTYQDFELILLDDCSPDEGASRAIIERYKSNPHVSHIVYNEVNSGSTFKQWHKGFELAIGEYIWIAESDDSCDSRLLGNLMNVITKSNAVMAFCRSLQYEIDGNKTHYSYQDNLGGSFVMDGNAFIKKYLIDKNSVANASSVVFRKDATTEIDQSYTQLKGAGDWLFWLMLAEQGNVCFVDEELNYYRHHTMNTTKKSMESGLDARERIVIFRYLENAGQLKGKRKFIYRMKSVRSCQNAPYDAEVKKDLLKLWDRFYFYRILYPLYQLSSKLIKFIK